MCCEIGHYSILRKGHIPWVTSQEHPFARRGGRNEVQKSETASTLLDSLSSVALNSRRTHLFIKFSKFSQQKNSQPLFTQTQYYTFVLFWLWTLLSGTLQVFLQQNNQISKLKLQASLQIQTCKTMVFPLMVHKYNNSTPVSMQKINNRASNSSLISWDGQMHYPPISFFSLYLNSLQSPAHISKKKEYNFSPLIHI